MYFEFISVTTYILCLSSDFSFQAAVFKNHLSIFKLEICRFCISVCFLVVFPFDSLIKRSNDLSRDILSNVCVHLFTRRFVCLKDIYILQYVVELSGLSTFQSIILQSVFCLHLLCIGGGNYARDLLQKSSVFIC